MLFAARPAESQTFTLVASSVSESVGTAIISIRNTTGSTQVASWSAGGGTATAGSDYTVSSRTTFMFSNGVQFTASVPITDDDIDEGDETFHHHREPPSDRRFAGRLGLDGNHP